ncbi:ciliogenesis-associated TTC17-interacting protein-like [Nomia melanderi]|uniref:ciliogenesis-associated TTC17-interacting protein-like n=1 Tax=Nomia melanderi TaxID=2448451 RepID=UPI003FCD77D8
MYMECSVSIFCECCDEQYQSRYRVSVSLNISFLPFFCTSDHGKRTALCFRETLMVCSKNEFAKDIKPVGGYCILVESIGPQTHEFLVYVQSSMSVDGHFGGTKVTSSVTSKFHCLEEKRTEFLHEGDSLHEKSIYIGIQDNSYHVKLTRTCQCDQSEETKDLSFCCNDRLISEGVNILLMRYLALTNYEGTLSLQTITIDGELITSNYKCTSSERMEMDGHFLNVYTVEREMHKQDGEVQSIKTYLTSQGRILRHNWLDKPYILKINPLADPTVTDNTISVETPLRDRWAEDIEMFSKYLDKKYSKMVEHTEYLADHPEVEQLIRDYTQTLLVVKPENVIDFTIQHFKAFAKDPISWETSTQKENSDVDVQSQLTKEKSELVCGACEFKIKSATPKEIPSRSSTEECPNTMVSIQLKIKVNHNEDN